MSDTTGQEFISEDDLQTFEGWLKYQEIEIPVESYGYTDQL